MKMTPFMFTSDRSPLTHASSPPTTHEDDTLHVHLRQKPSHTRIISTAHRSHPPRHSTASFTPFLRVGGLCEQVDGHDKTVQTQHLSKNKDEDHADEEPGLLRSSPHTGVSHDTNSEPSGQA